jgi:hypothetical protein
MDPVEADTDHIIESTSKLQLNGDAKPNNSRQNTPLRQANPPLVRPPHSLRGSEEGDQQTSSTAGATVSTTDATTTDELRSEASSHGSQRSRSKSSQTTTTTTNGAEGRRQTTKVSDNIF